MRSVTAPDTVKIGKIGMGEFVDWPGLGAKDEDDEEERFSQAKHDSANTSSVNRLVMRGASSHRPR